MLLNRKKDLAEIQKLLPIFPVVAILGARQCGKTTLARHFDYANYFDLENPRDLARFEQPQLTLENLEGLIVIDEIQRAPELFPLLRFLVDTKPAQKYLILGSASPELVPKSAESLAGRIGYYRLSGFGLHDVGIENLNQLWLCGGFPRSFLAESISTSYIWRENYIQTFLERDLPQLGIQIPARTLHRFWVMLSHYHGQIMNYAELGRAFGISDTTIRKYLDILEGTYMIRVLSPWYVNIGKRLVKRPKIYLRDSGIFHNLQSIETQAQLLTHPKLGASWEGFALECISQTIATSNQALFFWSTHSGAEVDLFWQSGGKNFAIEFKFMDAPRVTKSMLSAITDLKLTHLWIIYPGNQAYPLTPEITVLPLTHAITRNFFVTK
ncbi:ATP-binding protein [candidate division KSB1 bacterium]|nr:ATP-binding protein [candidate division KSB1 bacterium]